MGAGQSDLYKKTYGDNIDNIPDEANPNCKHFTSMNKLSSETYSIKMTDAQKSTINTLNNTIRDHLKEEDFSGTRLELEGRPIVGKMGTPFQHFYEMKISRKTLSKVIKSLEGSLGNPNLGNAERLVLQESLIKATAFLQRINNLFEEFGEI